MLRPQKIASRAFHRGLTLLELLVAMTILLVIMVGIAGLLESSWQSFSDLKWQNRVDSEARHALDSMCDSVRMAGAPLDFYDNYPKRGFNAVAITENMESASSASEVSVLKNAGEPDDFYNVSDATPAPYLARYNYDNGAQMAAIYISGVHLDYEYRTISAPDDLHWTFDTVTGLTANSNSDIYFTVKTVYITVTASFNPYPNSIDSRTYTRTLTSAVTLRAPFNMPIPPSQVNGP